MRVRNATLEDCKAIATVQVNSYPTVYASFMPAEYLTAFSIDDQEQDWFELLLFANGEVLLVAQNDERLGLPVAGSVGAGVVGWIFNNDAGY